MLVLLPPSESKTAPEVGPALDLSRLMAAQVLTGPRREVMAAVARASSRDDAAQVLGLGPRSAADAALNLVLDSAPCVPARELFTGVLHDAAALTALGRLGKGQARVIDRHVLILSGLWGVLRPGDPVPDHRLRMGTTLPGPGRLSAFWRPYLAQVLAAGARGRLVVDCRSADYAAPWRARVGQSEKNGISGVDGAHEVLRVVVAREGSDGHRRVVSHGAKHVRGLLTGALLRGLVSGELGKDTGSTKVAEVAAGLEGVVGVELGEPAPRTGARDLTLVTR